MISSRLFRTLFLSATVAITAFQQITPAWADELQSGVFDIQANGAAASAKSDEVNLKGVISVYEGPSPDQLVGSLVSTALNHDKDAEKLTQKNDQMHDPFHKAWQKTKIVANFVSEYRGFEMSSEGADIILGDKLRLKSESSTEYATQKKADELHAKVFSSLLQMGQGLGESDPETKAKSVAAGYEPLRQLVGAEAADAALNTLKAWSNQISVPTSMFEQKPWSVMDLQSKTDDLVKTTAKGDPVMDLTRRALRRYNTHSKFSLGAAKAINVALSVGMFTPTIAAPVSEIMLFVFQMATGGPEDYKLLTELYLDKRMECRWKRLNQESAQAINAYNNAVMTKNPVLLGLSESFISVMGGEETSSRIIGNHRLVARRSTHDDAIDCLQTHGAEM